MQKVVTIGGGGGHSAVIKALKDLPIELTAVCNTADNGGGSGRLMRDYGVQVPGEVRNILSALADENGKFLNYRFDGGELQGQTIGNLLLSGLELSEGSFEQAIEKIREWLHIKHQVYPITQKGVVLNAKTVQNRSVVGQLSVVQHLWKSPEDVLEELWIEPKNIPMNPRAKQALEAADMIIVCMGDLYSSISPCLAVAQMNTILKKTKAKVVWLPNVVSAPGHIHYTSIKSALEFLQTLCPHFNPQYIIFPQEKILAKDLKSIQAKGYNETFCDVETTENTKVIQTKLLDTTKIKKLKSDVVERSPLNYNLHTLTNIFKDILYDSKSNRK